MKISCNDCQEDFTVVSGPSLVDFCCPECGGANTECSDNPTPPPGDEVETIVSKKGENGKDSDHSDDETAALIVDKHVRYFVPQNYDTMRALHIVAPSRVQAAFAQALTLARKDEREACAKVAERMTGAFADADEIAAAIRARGSK